MLSVEEIFKQRENDLRYNTSYPLSPSQWERWRSSEPLSFADETDASFYIHIPFCKSLCRFCEYVRFKAVDEETERMYLQIVGNDIANFVNRHAEHLTLHGFDIGGGTPTALSYKSFSGLLLMMNSCAERMKLSENFCGSIEASFSTIDKEKVRIIASSGRFIRRISFGLQSVNRKFLLSNNRDNVTLKHKVEIFNEIRKQGISLLNLDLMYGFPRQTEADLSATMKVVRELSPEHLTLYELRTNMLNGYQSLNRDELFRQYEFLYHQIINAGYEGRFGQNTFSRVGDMGLSSYLQHRMTENGAYKGFGIAAQSKNRHGISYNIGKRDESLATCLSGQTFETDGDIYILPPQEILAKYLAISGYCGFFHLSVMQEIMQANPLEVFPKQFGFLEENGLINKEGDTFYLTPDGFRHYGAVLSLFYPLEYHKRSLASTKTRNCAI